tara:strand:+ start:231 stop:458 length:228 start_codon:yes stop_codon:yes gene_type:complete
MTIRAIKVVMPDRDHKDDLGSIHISGSTLCGTETLCGNVDTFVSYEETEESVTCRSCAEIYRSIKASRKRLKFDC